MRVVVGEDEALLRGGLVLLLEQAGHEVVGEAADADTLVSLVDDLRPDLLVTDIRMPPRGTDDGLLAALAVRDRQPDVAVVVLSQHVQRSYARELLARCSSSVGYLLKQRVSDVTQFLADLQAVGDGATVLDPEVVELAMSRAQGDLGLERLTERQREVLHLMAQGRSNAWIARALFVSEKAVVVHASNIYAALDLPPSSDDHRRVLAVLRLLG
ncbi:MAG: two component transcriptional regulator, LuxR family [Frankiales bacterium]|nr:two component transcriptional regulator, LuxR family [Frankiales bacterium]